MKPKNVYISALMAAILTAMVFSVALAGNNFIIGDLRVDLAEVYNARDYRVHIAANAQPTTGDRRDFTTAWLGIFLAQYNGTPGSGKFTQVGIVTTRDGIQWFVYAEPGVTCLRGTKHPTLPECNGDYNDLVSLGRYTRVELKKNLNEDYWRAIVYDANSIGYVVAQIPYNSNRIYLARSDTEEGYYEANDPYITANFYHWHPQYLEGGVWKDWPVSTGGSSNSTIWVSPSSICPTHYGATPNQYGDERAWFAGTGGKVCEWLLFPSAHVYLPLVVK